MTNLGETEKKGIPEARREYLKARLKELKKTQAQLAQALGMEPSRLSERLRRKDPDVFTPGELRKIAVFLEIPFFKAVGKLTSVEEFDEDKFIYLQVLGEAEEGKWKQDMLKQADVGDYIIVEREDTNYPNMYGLRVTGNSMDQFYPPYKTTVICVPYVDIENKRKEFCSGRHVVACKRGPEGQYEITVKELLIENGHIYLMTKSQSAAHASYEINDKDDEDAYYGTHDIKIIALVVRAVVDQPVPAANQNAEGLPVP